MPGRNGRRVSAMRRFVLVRHQDVSGVSGTGIVAEGVRFSDGVVALRWLRAPHATNIYPSVGQLLAVHGHNGLTELRWLDDSVGLLNDHARRIPLDGGRGRG